MHTYVENGKRYLPNMVAQFAFCGKLATENEQLSLLEKMLMTLQRQSPTSATTSHSKRILVAHRRKETAATLSLFHTSCSVAGL